MWGFSQNGEFTLKLATWAIKKPIVHPRYKIFKWIWKSNVLSKMKVFQWLTIRETPLTCECLIARRLEMTNTCYLGNQSSKNINHIFKSCPFALGVWD